jgi:uncharacterized membrane protein
VKPDVREASLEPGPEQNLPGGFAGQAGPFAILGVAALWLRAHFDELPERIPVHWNASGRADSWVPRTPLGAGLPLLFGAALCLTMVGMQLALRRGSPRGAMRAAGLRVFLAVEYFIALLCCGVLAASATSGRLLVPVLVFSFAGVLVLVVVAIAITRGLPREPVRNPSAWRAGIIYFDPDDPALFVPKRSGLGYTFNFARPSALLITVVLLVLPLAVAVYIVNAR